MKNALTEFCDALIKRAELEETLYWVDATGKKHFRSEQHLQKYRNACKVVNSLRSVKAKGF